MNYLGFSGLASLVFFGIVGGWVTNRQLEKTIIIHGPSTTQVAKAQEPAQAEGKKEPLPDRLDLVKEWKKPEVTLFITGGQHGYIEPCGCTGLENQKGGLMRRRDCQKILQDRSWNLVSLDLGDQIRRTTLQSNLKLRATYETMTKLMRYDCIGLGPEDLKLAVADIVQLIANSIETETPFTCSNVTVVDESFVAPFRIVTSNGKRIGVVMALGDDADVANNNAANANNDIKRLPAAKGIETALAKMQKTSKCDALILLAQTTKEVCLKYAQQFPFDLIVVGDCPGEPTMLAEKVFKNDRMTQVIEVGTKGMHVGLVACNWNNGKLEMTYERIPLDARFQDDPAAKHIFVNYQKELEVLYNNPADFPDIQPRKTPSGLTYAGSERCNDCHEEEYEIWKDGIEGNGGPHARATEDLISPKNNPRAEIKRNFDPECLSCHVTGWNPQNYFPYESGYRDLQKDTALHGNGCENCHGPGKEHADAEDGSNEDLQSKFRKLVRRELKDAEAMCIECHDIDNSPDFLKKGFSEYWKHIKH